MPSLKRTSVEIRQQPAASSRAVAETERGKIFYDSLDLDVGFYSAMWHSFNVGHLLSTDVDGIARRHGISMADLLLLGALRIERAVPLRASDLAVTLQVSNAVVSTRIARLARSGLLTRAPSTSDRRAFELRLTATGAATVEAVLQTIEKESSFVRHYNSLPGADRDELARIMGELHGRMDRDFLPVRRGNASGG